MQNTEILKHPDCPFDVIVRDGNGIVRYKQTQSMEPANQTVVLLALLIREIQGLTAATPQVVEKGKLIK